LIKFGDAAKIKLLNIEIGSWICFSLRTTALLAFRSCSAPWPRPDFNTRPGEPFWYSGEFAFPKNKALQEALGKLPEHEQWAVVENLTLGSGLHAFIARSLTAADNHKIDFTAPDWQSLRPQRHPLFRRAARTDTTIEYQYGGPHGIKLPLITGKAALLEAADGKRSIAEIMSDKRFASATPELVRNFYSRMWSLGFLFASSSGLRRSN
jgi:hypothetical protein